MMDERMRFSWVNKSSHFSSLGYTCITEYVYASQRVISHLSQLLYQIFFKTFTKNRGDASSLIWIPQLFVLF